MDGLDVLKQSRQKDTHLPVLVLTARDGVDDRIRGLDLGADDYLVKPFEPKELLLRINAILRRVPQVKAAEPVRQVRVENSGISAQTGGFGVSLGGKLFLNDAKTGDASQLPAIQAHPVIEPILMIQSFYHMANALSVARGHDPVMEAVLAGLSATQARVNA